MEGNHPAGGNHLAAGNHPAADSRLVVGSLPVRGNRLAVARNLRRNPAVVHRDKEHPEVDSPVDRSILRLDLDVGRKNRLFIMYEIEERRIIDIK